MDGTITVRLLDIVEMPATRMVRRVWFACLIKICRMTMVAFRNIAFLSAKKIHLANIAISVSPCIHRRRALDLESRGPHLIQ